MPAFSFKERFVPMVKDGSKTQTIRSFRKAPFRVGTPAHLFYGMRTKFCTKLIDPSPAIKTLDCVLITAAEDLVIIWRDFLTPAECKAILSKTLTAGLQGYDWSIIHDKKEKDLFAWQDGFRHADNEFLTTGCFDIMIKWWKQTHELPFVGNLIRWEMTKEEKIAMVNKAVSDAHTEIGKIASVIDKKLKKAGRKVL